jgi:hypothetical protein
MFNSKLQRMARQFAAMKLAAASESKKHDGTQTPQSTPPSVPALPPESESSVPATVPRKKYWGRVFPYRKPSRPID